MSNCRKNIVREEHARLKQELRNRQLQATELLVQIRKDPKLGTKYKKELDRVCQEANALAIRIIELVTMTK